MNGALGVNSIACALLKVCTDPETTTPLSVTWRAPVMVPAFMGALVNSVTTVLAGTFVAPLPGRMAITEGAVFESSVVSVNWLVMFDRALPEKS